MSVSFPPWSHVTAVMGGTFDPPHLGHVEALEGLFRNPGIERAIVVVSGRPVFKTTLTQSTDRLEMARLAFAPFIEKKQALISTEEIDRAEANPADPSYTFDTLTALTPHFKNLAFVVGTDQLVDLKRWHRFLELLSLCHWIVLERKGFEGRSFPILASWKAEGLASHDAAQPNHWRLHSGKNSTSLAVVPTEAREMSSAQIREAIARTGKLPSNSVPPAVEEYLLRRGLYGTQMVNK
jgi:nicotinate-nucleotide adenylyltransferase